MSKLGDRLRELRGIKSIRDVEAELGIDRSDISKYERGRFVPSPDRLLRIAEYYQASYRELRKLSYSDMFSEPEEYALVLEWAQEQLQGL